MALLGTGVALKHCPGSVMPLGQAQSTVLLGRVDVVVVDGTLLVLGTLELELLVLEEDELVEEDDDEEDVDAGREAAHVSVGTLEGSATRGM